MSELVWLAVMFAGSLLVGYLLIARVPPRLHTPLMSMTNAISAVTILGAVLLFAVETTLVQKLFGALAVALAAFNVAGGFTITDRMLRMFRRHHG
jgi:NAD(P) transhydrogenase subunit alpha